MATSSSYFSIFTLLCLIFFHVRLSSAVEDTQCLYQKLTEENVRPPGDFVNIPNPNGDTTVLSLTQFAITEGEKCLDPGANIKLLKITSGLKLESPVDVVPVPVSGAVSNTTYYKIEFDASYFLEPKRHFVTYILFVAVPIEDKTLLYFKATSPPV